MTAPVAAGSPRSGVESVTAARDELAATTADLEATIARAASLDDDDRHRRVGDEWSVVESLRHLVLVARPVPAHAGTVAGALGVLLDELRFHRGFMERDLGKL